MNTFVGTYLPSSLKLTRISLALMLLCIGTPVFAQCSVPVSLAGKVFVNVIDQSYSPRNPNAGNLLKIKFGVDTYTNTILNLGKQVKGTYTYTRLANNLGQFNAEEDFEGEVTKYTLTLVCVSDVTGTLIYTQERGAIKPNIRQNVGRYTIDQ